MVEQIEENVSGVCSFVHETACIDWNVTIGIDSKIWHFSHILHDSIIGDNCNIGQNVVIGPNVTIGNNCKIQNNVSIYTGVILEDEVFCGPSMVFTNVINPRSSISRMSEIKKTLVKKGSTIGANATIVCGNTIGEYSFIGAGAVVTHDTPAYSLMIGNPARLSGWVCSCGLKLNFSNTQECMCKCGKKYIKISDKKIEFSPGVVHINHVPLLDLKSQYNSIKKEIDNAVLKVLENQHFILGPDVEELEKKIADYCQCKYAVGVSSGTDALLLALMSIDIEPGDEVITTPYTFFATAGVISRLGAKPVFVDINPDTYNINADLIEYEITGKTKAIIPVHLYGQCADMDRILEIGKDYSLSIIEDAAQAIGSEYKGKRSGSLGLMGCFSFFPSKNLGGIGDGGIVTTNDKYLYEKLKILRVHGSNPKYYHKVVGGNFRLDAINAAVLKIKLKYLDMWTTKRQKNAEYYNKLFEESGVLGKIQIPKVKKHRHVFNQYVIKTERRDELKDYLKEHGIGTEVYYPVPLHLQECFKDLGYCVNDFPYTEESAKTTLALPIYPELGRTEIDYVVFYVKEFFLKNEAL